MDNDPKKWQSKLELKIENKILSFDIKNPKELLNTDFDSCILATTTGYEESLAWLLENGVEESKIQGREIELKIKPRITFLRNFATKFKNLEGNVAELGVFRGEFAKYINGYFKDKILYLFDTFEGFDTRDLENEGEIAKQLGGGHLSATSIELVKNKMPYPNKVEFKKGWFPQTTKGLEDKTFCFVNLDADLYEPTLAGLEWFYPRLVKGGVILVHDYFNEGYKGVKKAVDEFCAKNDLFALPIGDDISVMIQRLE